MGLITEEVEVVLYSNNIKYYESLGYKIPRIKNSKTYKTNVPKRTKIKINVRHLSKKSNVKVDVQCDNCKKIKNIRWQDYQKYKRENEKYYCKNCALQLFGREKRKLSFEYIKNYIEVESNSGCKLISNEFNYIYNKLIIQCKCGEIFETSFNSFKGRNKHQCNQCGQKISNDKQKIPYEIVKKKIEELGFILHSSDYMNSYTKLIVSDNEGYFYFLAYRTICKTIQNGGNLSRFHKSNPYTIQNIKLWCKLNNKPFELISEVYERNNKKLEWRCLKENCGEVFKLTWDAVRAGQGCAVCAGMQIGLSNCLATKRPDLASEWHPTLNGDLTPYDVTVGSNKEVWWICDNGHEWKNKISMRNIHGECPYCNKQRPSKEYNLLIIQPEICKDWDYSKNKEKPEQFTPNSNKKVWWKCSKNPKHEWKATINDRTQGRGCPYCAGKLPSEDYNLLVINPELCKDWNYNKNRFTPENCTPNARKKVWWLCNNCGHKWRTYVYSRNKGIGCPKCNETSGEKKIREYLEKNNILLEAQKEFEGLVGLGGGNLSYDFYLPEYNILIEYQGQFHDGSIKNQAKRQFERQQEHDRRKREYAKTHNIDLLEIWYWDYDNIENILSEKLKPFFEQNTLKVVKY